ncbi:hypothetical protein BKH46_01005 [Helicobacter sp. 12S02634-8]|uniref:peroxide stress protein YaaA n=1 Tax=Helicobacter sp. 12S02634-8 TaxID=1476199 RepID=UPI000BA749ED|nr:peroxide stress protein YaaA [Helicobacter sp. 12S02634-8]PAF48515.1 hypothetical protein BKH46_01005 [Helicobacter sp. 12S02634-8]
MKILFSPSEGKRHTEISRAQADFSFLDDLPSKGEALRAHIARYRELLNQDDTIIAKMLGFKHLGSQGAMDELLLCTHLGKTSTIEAIRLYDGVSYKALDFENLPQRAQEYVLGHTLICSNLFGLVRASDKLAFYKCNQNFKFQDFSLQTLYKRLAPIIDVYLGDALILDLRAEIYIKAYPLKGRNIRIEFYQDGKKISHYAKYYRGLYLRALSLEMSSLKGERIEEMEPERIEMQLERLEIQGARLAKKDSHHNTTTLVYQLV